MMTAGRERRILRKAQALVKLEDAQLEARRRLKVHRARGWRAPKQPKIVPGAELRELLIREASFNLWRRWWPELPAKHLRQSIGQFSLAVLVYMAHKRLGKDIRRWWTL